MKQERVHRSLSAYKVLNSTEDAEFFIQSMYENSIGVLPDPSEIEHLPDEDIRVLAHDVFCKFQMDIELAAKLKHLGMLHS